jgi:K+-transporting ATPase ATPase C chain
MKMIRLLVVLTLICGILYPLVVTIIASSVFPEKAQGSLIKNEEHIIGSKLLAQSFKQDDFFHPRPSFVEFATVASGASQASPTQMSGSELREKRRALLPEGGVDAWTNSGSGLDPHISPQTAFAQVKRVAAARGIPSEKLHALVEKFIEGSTFGIWGQPRVNVLELNLALSKGTNADAR